MNADSRVFLWFLGLLSILGLGPGYVEASPNGSVCGQVDGLGGPLHEVSLELRPVLDNYTRSRRLLRGLGYPEQASTTKADGEGRFCVEVPGIGVWRLLAKAPGFVPMQYFPLPLGDAADVELPPVRLLPDEGTRVHGSSPDGHPLAAAVYAVVGETSPWSSGSADGWRVASRFGWLEDGTIALPRAEGERLDLYVHLPGSGRLERAQDMEHARFVLPGPSGGSVEIEVSSGGRPVPDAVVGIGAIAWPVGLTDEEGRVTLSGLRRRLVRLVVLSKSGAVVRRTIDLATQSGADTVAVELPVGRRVTGSVADADGEPIPGALAWIPPDPGRFDRADADGHFELTMADDRRIWIQGHARGFLAGSRRIEPEPGERVRVLLQLERALEVRGRVVDGEGDSFPGVDVSVVGNEPSDRRVFRLDSRMDRARSDSEGRFALGVGAGDTWTLRAEHAGYRTASLRLDTGADAEPGEERHEVVLRLARHRSGFGRVLDREQRPLDGITVWLLPAGEQDRVSLENRARRGELPPELSAETDGDGLFRLDHLPAPEVDLVAYGPGHAPTVVPGIAAAGDEGPIDLGRVVLRPGVDLAGRLLDADRDPIAGAPVRLLDPGEQIGRLGAGRSRNQGDPESRSDPDGRFRLSDLAPRTPVRIGVDADGYLPAVVDLSEADPEELVEIVLDPAGVLRGSVEDPNGVPMVGARVTVNPAAGEAGVVGGPPAGNAERSVLTDEEGTFAVDEMPPGTYALQAYRDGFLDSRIRTLEVSPEAPQEGIALRLREGAVVEGWVLTEAGRAVEGATVMFGRPATRSGPDGSFVVEGVEPGTTTVGVRHPEFAWIEETRELEPGLNVVELQLRSGAHVEGTALGPDGDALAGATVRLTRESRPSREYVAQSRSDGGFVMESVQPGIYRVTGRREPLVPADAEQRVEVGADGLEGVVVRFRSGAMIRGSIVGLDLDELARVRVTASASGRSTRRGQVDHSGAFHVGPLAPGVWWLKASLPGQARETEARVVVDEDATDVARDLDLGAGLELRGLVLVDGAPSQAVEVILTGLDRSVSRRGRTDLKGRFDIGNLPEGRYRLTATHARRSLIHNEVVELFGDREITVQIESATVRGVVRSAATGEPLADAVVQLGQIGESAGIEVSRMTVGTGTGGTFRISELTAGRYRLEVRHDGHVPRTSELDLGAGESLDLQLELMPAAGLRLHVRSASGPPPRWAYVRLTDAESGRVIEATRALDGELLEVPTVPAGVWQGVLAAPGGAPVELRANVPGPPARVTLPPGGRLRLEAPALEELGLEGTVRLSGPDGQPVRALDLETGMLRSSWPWRRNGIVIDSVPAGQWLAIVEATDGSVWTETVVTGGKGVELVVLR